MHGSVFWHQHFVSLSGTDFQCNLHIIPVKKEEGIVMMFILNFDYILDEGSDNSTEKISPTSPTKSDQSGYLIFSALITIIEWYLLPICYFMTGNGHQAFCDFLLFFTVLVFYVYSKHGQISKTSSECIRLPESNLRMPTNDRPLLSLCC